MSELDQLPDQDTEETAEWQASLDAVVRNAGPDRAVYLLRRRARAATARRDVLDVAGHPYGDDRGTGEWWFHRAARTAGPSVLAVRRARS